MSRLDDSDDDEESAIIQYANRLQKLLAICTDILFGGGSLSQRVRWLRSIIVNLPPTGKDAFKTEWTSLSNFEANNYSLNDDDLEPIYSRLHDWIYLHVLQDAFKIKPIYRKKGILREGASYSDNKQAQGLGVPSA